MEGGNSWANVEVVIHFRLVLPDEAEVLDMRRTRTDAEIADQNIQQFLAALRDDFDLAGMQVPHVATDTQRSRLLQGEVTEADALDQSRYDNTHGLHERRQNTPGWGKEKVFRNCPPLPYLVILSRTRYSDMQRRTFLKSTAVAGAAALLPWKGNGSIHVTSAAPPDDQWLQDAVSEAVAMGALSASALFLSHRRQSLQIRKTDVHSITDDEAAGITLTVRVGGGMASASVPTARKGSPKDFARTAVDAARLTRTRPANSAPPKVDEEGDVAILEHVPSGNSSPKIGRWSPDGLTDPFQVPLSERVSFLAGLTGTALKISQIPYAVANQFLQRRDSLFVDSDGSRIGQTQYATYVNFAVTAFHQQKRLMDTRTSEREAQMTDWAGATANMLSELETAMQEVLRLQQADPVTQDSYDLVVHPTLLWNILFETLLPHFDPRQLLGLDGRSPADRWLTLAKFNERPLRIPALRLSWDPTLPGGLATCGWDDVGNESSQRRILDEAGVLQAIPVSPDLLASDELYASLPRMSFSRAPSWNVPATVAMPNVVLAGGPGKSLDDLIGGVDSGLFVKGRGTVVTNPARTLFRVRPQSAWMIRGGKIAEMVRDVEIETSVEQFWNALEEVGRDEDRFLGGDLFPGRAFPLWETPFSVATPPALFRRVSVYRAEGRP